jgi:exodeoxyribonuclease V beta subunit
LLQGGARGHIRIGGQPLEGGDIAILVRSHHQARQVQEQLRQRGVPSVQVGQDNVFCSGEAEELERVLLAVTEPTHETRLRGALATVMLGATGEALWALSQDEAASEARLETFLEYHRLWRERGFARMFRTLVSREGMPKPLLQFQDGERRMTNLRHLAERLQTAANRECAGVEGLIGWLAERRRCEASADEEAQLRLESDEHLVKIVTIHKSKGLEYPVVFCPFLWSGGCGPREPRRCSATIQTMMIRPS